MVVATLDCCPSIVSALLSRGATSSVFHQRHVGLGEPDAAKFIRESFAGGDWQGFLRKITGDRTRLKLYPYFVATFFAGLGEQDKAFAALNEALETKDQHTSWMKVDPFMDPLRDDPRFKELLKRAGFPE